MSELIKCYRFVKDDLTSENGELSWKIGEWNQVSGEIICCSNGLHAALTPRDSLRNVYGQRWFTAEAKGEIINKGNKIVASEMRIIQEIPKTVVQKFAVWCAKDCLKYYENNYPEDKNVSECIQAAGNFLDGKIKLEEVDRIRKLMPAITARGAAGRAAASTSAAMFSMLAPNSASWANAAAAAAYAAHLIAVATNEAIALVEAQTNVHNVESNANAAIIADHAAHAAHRAASAGATAHAAAVTAARNTVPADTASDAYYSSFAAFSALNNDTYYDNQNEILTELIVQTVGSF